MLLYVIEYFLYGINPIIGVFNLKTNLFEIFQQLSSNYPFKVNNLDISRSTSRKTDSKIN